VNVTQVDVFDSGRAVTDIIARDLEQLTACNLNGIVNIQVVPTTNSFGLVPSLKQLELNAKSPLPNNVLRTNVVQEAFFLTKATNLWTAIGYRVMDATYGVGTLYRYAYTTNIHGLTNPVSNPRIWFSQTRSVSNPSTSPQLHRVADGVVHLRLSAYDQQGNKLDATMSWHALTNSFPNYGGNNDRTMAKASPRLIAGRDVLRQTSYFFLSNGLPAYIELELGVLEPETFKQYLSLANPSLAQGFLQERANKVHLFRELIPIRNAVQ
jgi:hypothetical protein